MEMRKVFIVGAGLMGSGIAQVCATAGLQVTLCDESSEALERALKNIAWSAGKLVEKQKAEGPLETIMKRIVPATDFALAGEADLCIEAVFEKLDLKKEIFEKLGAVARPEALVASNTSAISISTLAACTSRADRVLGLHFFNPVPMMAAVEVVRGQLTTDEVFLAGNTISRSKDECDKGLPDFLGR